MTKLPRTPSFGLDGKRALVTGASSGIGLGCAAALAQAGARVVLSARRESKLEELREDFAAEGWSADILVLDVAEVEATADAVAAHGPFDILVNSAGLARHSAAVDTTPDDFDAVMGLNLRGAYFLAQAVARGLIAAGKPGSIVNIGSVQAGLALPGRTHYAPTKRGIEALTRNLAAELAPHGIRVNCVHPGLIDTDMTQWVMADPATLPIVLDKIPLGRAGLPREVAPAVLFFAGDEASYVTGQTLYVDGGMVVV